MLSNSATYGSLQGASGHDAWRSAKSHHRDPTTRTAPSIRWGDVCSSETSAKGLRKERNPRCGSLLRAQVVKLSRYLRLSRKAYLAKWRYQTRLRRRMWVSIGKMLDDAKINTVMGREWPARLSDLYAWMAITRTGA